MTRYTGVWLAALFCLGSAFGDEPKLTIRSLRMGDGQVDVVIREFGKSRYLLCNLHDDEDTSVQAAERVLNGRPGRLVELRHSGQRRVTFQLGDQQHTFDPNRIFTPAGVRRTLEDSADWSAESQRVVEEFGKQLIQLYGMADAAAVIALHNNSEARYAASSYLEGHDLAKEAAAVYLRAGSDPDDFFFVTEQRFFEALRRRDMNVVLQDNEAVTDDGSLSVYCGKQGVAYVNVEAQHGHLNQQIEMLEILFEVLDGRE